MDAEFQLDLSVRLVDDPCVERIVDRRIDKEFGADEYIASCRRDIAVIRQEVFTALDQGKSFLLCAGCHSPVYPKRYKDAGKFYFAHVGGNDQDCPYRERNPALRTERIDAMRYNGQKESSDHIRMKQLLTNSLNADPAFDPLMTRTETNWYGITDRNKWRRPDVSAARSSSNGSPLRIAFEVQLSSTYLKVIAARRRFYLEENALLFWIFKEASDIQPRQYQDDLFYNNNSNLFILDEQTRSLSLKKGKFILRCRYLEPRLNAGEINEEWRERLVSFDELTIIREKQRVFWFDYERARIAVAEEADKAAKEKEAQEIRRSYSGLWVRYNTFGSEFVAWEYDQLKIKLKNHCVIIPERPDKELHRFSTIVLSAKEGMPVANRYSSFLQLANYVYDKHKQFLWYFGKVVSHCGHWQKLSQEDKKAAESKRRKGRIHLSWTEKRKTIREGMARKDPEFEQNRNYDQLFYFLFPELKAAQGEGNSLDRGSADKPSESIAGK